MCYGEKKWDFLLDTFYLREDFVLFWERVYLYFLNFGQNASFLKFGKNALYRCWKSAQRRVMFHTQEEEITYPLLSKGKHFNSFLKIGIIGLYSCRIFQLLLISNTDTLYIDHTYAHTHTHTHTHTLPRVWPVVGMPWCKAFWIPYSLKLYVLSMFCLYHS